MRRLACQLLMIMALLFAWQTPVLAQDSGTVPSADEPQLGQQDAGQASPEMPAADQAVPAVGDVYHLLAIGDALGGGLGAGLTRLTETGAEYDVTNRFNESSGIARPEVYDWTEAVEKITADKAFSGVVVLLGSNDRQDIRLGQFHYAFNTPDWVAAYKLQIDTLIDTMKAKGLQVYWVSIPPMQDPTYNADMMMLNELIKERVAAKGESFVDIRPAFLAADGSYADRGEDETGAQRKLRSSDGVGFFKAGNNRMAQLVLAAIAERRKSPGAQPVAEGAPAPEVPATPVLGQAIGDGASETFDTKDIAAALAAATDPAKGAPVVKSDAAAPVASSPAVRIIDVMAAPGSDAEVLFTTGVAPTPPAGRFDDFSVGPSQ